MKQVPYWVPTNGRCHPIHLGNLVPEICVPLDGCMCAGMHTLSICQCHYNGGIILKWKSVKWNTVCNWKYSLVEMHWVIVPCHIRQLQGGYSCSYAEKCWLLTHITVDSVYIHTVAIFEQCVDEGRHWIEGISSWACRVFWVYSASNFMKAILLSNGCHFI